ncbi:ABC transporter substrate-binding protein [Arhodomonas sp. SL1]|uniref:ABC transporter substrate-binding protein n=1 Tax=Arhodomonas sp. SL1 TaxID=3425691 RepID=UPI003F882D67
MNRRFALRRMGAAVSALCLSLGVAAGVQAQEDPVRLGAIYIMSGTPAVYGEFARQGMEIAVDEINEGGGILGRDVEFLLEDSQIKADAAIQAARKLVYQEQVDGLMGLDSSGVATGVVPVVPELQRPFLITHAATPDVTGKLCNRYTYRLSVNISQNTKAAAEIAAETGAKRWTTLGPDYAFGHQSWEFFGDYLQELDSEVELMENTAFPRFGNEDFTPFINNVMDAEPDGVLVSLWGGDLVNFIRQANNLGFFEQDFEVLMTLGGATEVLSALGEQMPEGVWVGTRYWFDAHDNPMNDHLVRTHMERYGAPPSYNAAGAYAGIHAYKAAMEKAGTTDPEAVTDALSGLTFQAPNGELTLREGDHQAVVGPTWGVTSAVSEEYGVRMLDPMRTFDGELVTPDVADTGCNL